MTDRPSEHPIMLLTRYGLVWNPASPVGRIMPVVECLKPVLGYGRAPARPRPKGAA